MGTRDLFNLSKRDLSQLRNGEFYYCADDYFYRIALSEDETRAVVLEKLTRKVFGQRKG
jgi:hypothetical protein